MKFPKLWLCYAVQQGQVQSNDISNIKNLVIPHAF